jgi:nitrate reductase gamma subunit
MIWYKIIALAALAICILISTSHILRLIKLGKPTDYSRKSGSTTQAIRYSFTGAMSPKHKESAYLHLPTYTAGIVFHLGTFVSIGFLLVTLLGIALPITFTTLFLAFLLLSVLCGLGILLKRMVSAKLRNLSSPDDYISNILVTLFQVMTCVVLIWPKTEQFYYVWIAILLLYLPIGKLKHVYYFFAARYHLGVFYGWRGTWPPK